MIVRLASPFALHCRTCDGPLCEADLAAATRELTDAVVAAVPRGVRVADYGLEGFVYWDLC